MSDFQSQPQPQEVEQIEQTVETAGGAPLFNPLDRFPRKGLFEYRGVTVRVMQYDPLVPNEFMYTAEAKFAPGISPPKALISVPTEDRLRSDMEKIIDTILDR